MNSFISSAKKRKKMCRTIAVFGATGNQGGSVLRSLTKTGGYHVKAITRDPEANKAKHLFALNNVSVHQADLDDPFSLDIVLRDCYGVFLVTSHEEYTVKRETQQGINLIDSAIRNRLAHIVYSGAENISDIIGKPCCFFDSKALVEDYGLKQSDKIMFTSIRIPAYFQELTGKSISKIQPSQFVLTFPIGDSYLFGIDYNDVGDCVENIFNNSHEFKSKLLKLAGDKLKTNEIVETLNKHLAPNQFFSSSISIDKYRLLGFPGCDDLATMFEYFKTGKFFRDVALTKRINKNVLNFNDWVSLNRQELLVALSTKKICIS